ncbi:MAG TPA: zinc ribbon domain-containing protein [Kofleriaceae bacterium]|nr:zinc ribbon domain-containing protein [Kofleriaceae bacterium]
MPLFDFECRDCHHRYEAMNRFGEPLPPCPQCGSAAVDKVPGFGTIRTKVPEGFSWENPRFRGQNKTVKKNPNFGKD